MSTVNSASSADVIASLQKTAAASTSKTTDAQSRFLKLLTEQLKNQDPLSPMDNAQMTSQLAQISTVDGIVKLNTTLTALLDGSQSSDAVQAAALWPETDLYRRFALRRDIRPGPMLGALYRHSQRVSRGASCVDQLDVKHGKPAKEQRLRWQ